MIRGCRERQVLFLNLFLFLSSLALNPGCHRAKDPVQWGKEYHYAVEETVRLKMGPHDSPLVPGKVNGREIEVFLDTGNFSGLQVGRREVDRITIGNKTFSVRCAKAANLKAISEGYPRPILMGVGADILSRVVLTVDYPQKKVLIE